MSDATNPLSGMTTGEELGVLGQTGRGILDWREGNLLELQQALASRASAKTPTASDALAPGWFEQPLLQAFAQPGVFAGAGAGSRWLPMARHMENVGFGPERINAATGWFKGADGEWRKTISDEGARLKTENLEKNQFDSDLVGIPRRWSSEAPLTLGDVLEHPKLFEAYPDLENIPVKPVGVLDSMSGLQGYYSPSANQLGLSGGRPERLLSTILHETQHAIQSKEGFARGGNVDEFLPEGFREAYGGLRSKWKDFEGEIRDAGANPFEIRTGLARTLGGNAPYDSFQKHWDMLRPDQQERALDLASQIAPLEATQRSAVDSYQRLAGEVESRTVEEQLAQKDWSRLPQQMEGYTPREEQIFKFDESGDESASIRGFHGTGVLRFEPVEENPFGEFRLDKVGTGEGAAAYGHGAAYVAGNRAVAEEYQRGLAGSRPTFADEAGNPLSTMETARKFYEPGTVHPSYGGDFDKVLRFNEHPDSRWSVDVQRVVPSEGSQAYGNLGDLLNSPDAWRPHQFERPRNHSTFPSDKDLEDIGNIRGYPMTQPGSLLEVHILPDEHELLDWDKPLSAQPEGVRRVIDKMHSENEDLRILNAGPDARGQHFYQNLAHQMWDKTYAGIGGGSAAASAALHEAGIPGIKYLDAGSRGPGFQIDGPSFPSVHGMRFDTEQQALDHISRRVGENVAGGPKVVEVPRTSNYVIFHPSNLRIVGRNGQRLEPIDEDPFK